MMSSAFLAAGGGGTYRSWRNSRNRQEQLESVNTSLDNTYVFDRDEDLSGLIEGRETVEFTDYHFNNQQLDSEESTEAGIKPENYHNLYEFEEETTPVAFYDKIINEPTDSESLRRGIDQILTVREVEEGQEHILDIGIDREFAGRFIGYTEEDIDHLLESGEPGREEIPEHW